MSVAAADVLADLATLRRGSDWGWVQVTRPAPTAAFSRRNTLAPGYPAALRSVRRHGFTPYVRPAGGHLAAYHEGALVVDVLARHSAPATAVDRRFAVFGEALADALRGLGVDARVGPVPGEYCPGRYSVSAAGRTKLAGTAQRVTRGSFLLSAVVLVSNPEPVRAVLTAAYPLLGLSFDPASVGCVADWAPGVSSEAVVGAVLTALDGRLPLQGCLPRAFSGSVRVPLTGPWDPA